MSVQRPDRISLPIRTFGVQEPAGDAQDDAEGEPTLLRRVLSRISFRNKQHRPSTSSRPEEYANDDGATAALSPTSERAPIPTMIQPSGEIYTTPLPVLSMIVLSIVRIADYLFLGFG